MTWVDNAEYTQGFRELISPLLGTKWYHGLEFSFIDTTRFDYFIDSLLQYTSLEGKDVLDSGCGSGGLCIRLLNHHPRHITGIELDVETSRLAKIRVASIPNITIINSDASMSSIPPQSFDVIFSIHVIEHVENEVAYLNEMTNLLKPGGILFLACPHRIWPFEAHTQLPLIHYLPRRSAKKIALLLAKIPFLSALYKRKLLTSTLYEHDFLHFQMKKMIKQAGLVILEQNHPRFFLDELRGRNWENLYRIISSMSTRYQWYLSALFSQNINVICKKPIASL